MGRKLGLTIGQVLAAAGEVADRDGLDALSLASVASALGVRSPSLHNHVGGLAGLRRQLSIHSSNLLTAELTDATEGLESTHSLMAIAEQLRSFAHRHPGLYDSFLPAPTPEQDSEMAAALAQPTNVVGSVLTEMGIDPTTVIPLIRALRASVRGFVHLELGAGFGLPDDIDDSFTTTIDLVIEAIAAHEPGLSSSGRSRSVPLMTADRMVGRWVTPTQGTSRRSPRWTASFAPRGWSPPVASTTRTSASAKSGVRAAEASALTQREKPGTAGCGPPCHPLPR